MKRITATFAFFIGTFGAVGEAVAHNVDACLFAIGYTLLAIAWGISD